MALGITAKATLPSIWSFILNTKKCTEQFFEWQIFFKILEVAGFEPWTSGSLVDHHDGQPAIPNRESIGVGKKPTRPKLF